MSEPKVETVVNDNSEREEKKYLPYTSGDMRSFIYFDTEFSELSKNAELISIGLCDYKGRSFYAELTDFDVRNCSEWTFVNVVKKLESPKINLDGEAWTMTGTKKEVSLQLNLWLQSIKETEMIQFCSDVCYYDFVLLVDLLTNGKTVFQLPKYIASACWDLNQDLAMSISKPLEEGQTMEDAIKNFIPNQVAFDISRENIIKSIGNIDILGEKHNSLHDAFVIRKIHQNLWGFNKKSED